jgi:hypothetical protein
VQQHVFEEVKMLKLCTTPMITLLYVAHLFDIEDDAYDYGIGIFLTRQFHSIVFYLETFNDAIHNF